MNINNPKAFHDYHILERYNAGLELKGHEVKSIKDGKANIKGSYVKVKKEIYIIGMHISKYLGRGEELRDKKLLLNRSEIFKIRTKVEQKGFTIIPLALFLSKGLVKIEIALAKGKKIHDKRETLMKKAIQRDIQRYTKRRR